MWSLSVSNNSYTALKSYVVIIISLAALELSSIHDTLQKHNIRLVAIGVEELGYQEFVFNKFFHGEIYIDTKLEAFERLGLKKLGMYIFTHTPTHTLSILCYIASRR